MNMSTPVLLLFLLSSSLFSFSEGYGYLNNWFPVVSKASHDFKNPAQVRILGKDFVVWKKNGEVIVQDDICPHRCAPLSEGYIDRTSNNLRCAYHGWEFNQCGNCTVVPQLDPTLNTLNEKKSHLRTYPTTEHGGMVWMFLGNASEPNFLAEWMNTSTPQKRYSFQKDPKVYVRELPISFYLLLENICDVAHVPFAHHKLQSLRSKGNPMFVKNLISNKSKNRYSVAFTSYSGEGKMGMGTVHFEYPIHYVLTNDYPPNGFLRNAKLFLVPVGEFKTRVFVISQMNIHHPFYKIYKRLPLWFHHMNTNKFLDSDSYLLKLQENHLNRHTDSYHNSREYYMPTQSDRTTIELRKWLKRNIPEIPFFYRNRDGDCNPGAQEKPKEVVLDRYAQHTKNCKHCMRALKNVNITKNMCVFFFLISACYLRSLPMSVLSVLGYKGFEKLERVFWYQNYVHNEID